MPVRHILVTAHFLTLQNGSVGLMLTTLGYGQITIETVTHSLHDWGTSVVCLFYYHSFMMLQLQCTVALLGHMWYAHKIM